MLPHGKDFEHCYKRSKKLHKILFVQLMHMIIALNTDRNSKKDKRTTKI